MTLSSRAAGLSSAIRRACRAIKSSQSGRGGEGGGKDWKKKNSGGERFGGTLERVSERWRTIYKDQRERRGRGQERATFLVQGNARTQVSGECSRKAWSSITKKRR